MRCIFCPTALILLVFSIGLCSGARPLPLSHQRKLFDLVPESPIVLLYHDGPLLSGDGALSIQLMWYGSFTASQRSAVVDFLASFQLQDGQQPSVSGWWKITSGYKDSSGSPVLAIVKPGEQLIDSTYSLGKSLKRSDIQTLISNAIVSKSFSLDSKSLYVVLTADDVDVDGFCMNSCAFHSSAVSQTDNNAEEKIVIGWVGNSASKCAGKCAWPYANPKSFGGPDTQALVPPNGDAGIDGMIINLAVILSGAATNPFNTGYYQGSADVPLEAATACTGIFGKGAFPGYAGELLINNSTGASFNVHGVSGRSFLVPALWNPTTSTCVTQ